MIDPSKAPLPLGTVLVVIARSIPRWGRSTLNRTAATAGHQTNGTCLDASSAHSPLVQKISIDRFWLWHSYQIFATTSTTKAVALVSTCVSCHRFASETTLPYLLCALVFVLHRLQAA